MIKIRPFKKEDLKAFKPIEPRMTEFSPEVMQAMEDSDLAVTGIRDGKIVGCGGVHPQGEHGDVWLRLSEDCKNYKLLTLRCLKEALKILEEISGFRQLNAYVKSDFCESAKMMKYLGFSLTQTATEKGQKWSIFSKVI